MRGILLLLCFISAVSLCSCGTVTYSDSYSSTTEYAHNTSQPRRNSDSGRVYSVHTGKRGGKYYINSHGNKVYVKKTTGSTYRTKSTKSSYRRGGGRRR